VRPAITHPWVKYGDITRLKSSPQADTLNAREIRVSRHAQELALSPGQIEPTKDSIRRATMLPFESAEFLAFIALTILRLAVPLAIIFLLGIVAKRIEQLQP
jgi:hypothetical protein